MTAQTWPTTRRAALLFILCLLCCEACSLWVDVRPGYEGEGDEGEGGAWSGEGMEQEGSSSSSSTGRDDKPPRGMNGGSEEGGSGGEGPPEGGSAGGAPSEGGVMGGGSGGDTPALVETISLIGQLDLDVPAPSSARPTLSCEHSGVQRYLAWWTDEGLMVLEGDQLFNVHERESLSAPLSLAIACDQQERCLLLSGHSGDLLSFIKSDEGGWERNIRIGGAESQVTQFKREGEPFFVARKTDGSFYLIQLPTVLSSVGFNAPAPTTLSAVISFSETAGILSLSYQDQLISLISEAYGELPLMGEVTALYDWATSQKSVHGGPIRERALAVISSDERLTMFHIGEPHQAQPMWSLSMERPMTELVLIQRGQRDQVVFGYGQPIDRPLGYWMIDGEHSTLRLIPELEGASATCFIEREGRYLVYWIDEAGLHEAEL